jgi:glutathione S-transferase
MAPRIVLYSPRGCPSPRRPDAHCAGRSSRSSSSSRRARGLPALLAEDGPAARARGRRRADPDSAAILDYLDEHHPEPPLLSADARVAREQRQLERWFDETFPFYILRWMQRRVGTRVPLTAPGGDGFPLGPLAQLGLIRDGKLSPEVFDTSDGGPGPEFVRRLDDLAHMLGKRRFFYADELSRADLSVCGSLSVMYRDVYPGARALIEARVTLFEHTERVLAATGGPDPV